MVVDERQMTVPGDAVLKELQRSLDEVRSQAVELQSQFQQLSNNMQKLVEQRGETFRDLAKHYLPELSPEAISATMVGVREELWGVLRRKQLRIDELTGQAARLHEERRRLESELDTVTIELNKKVEQREELQKLVAARLAEDQAFQKLSQQALEAETELHRNEERVAEIEGEAAEKLPAYESSRLFQYLLERQYGTPAYEHRGLTRRLDRWVARLVDFPQSRRNYQFLQRTPQLMREEVQRRAREFHKLMDQVEGIERHASDEAGLTRVLREGEALGKQRDELVARVDGQKERCQQVEQELLSLQQSQGQFYDEALERLRQFLTRTETAVLEHHARQTPEPTDDETVARIRYLEREIASIEPRVGDLSVQYEQFERQSQGLDFVVRRFQQSNFDSQRSHFAAGFDVAPHIERFRRGVTDKDDLWQSIRTRQEFEPSWVDQSAGQATDMINSPLAHVLMRAMVEAAGAAMQSNVDRSIRRRTYSPGRGGSVRVELPGPTWGRGPSLPPASFPSPSVGQGRGGFTSGRGF